ncbi:3-isopropylmalate dehydratase large subunit [Leuconostoc carnosum]|uniref:3-isopropylmalate dehydratase large subunit n=1 Tax=Leuconostoc carnosum TaxID=1252 RepID=UPI0012392C57|nr:3-isopropylmalate dehydratase large subunit [Leuconostoc carnosum]KAA8370363.1 3-isopropylmalate dehydratase large subunit [Leuconostoc carnosum]KAA8382010.1 3-isopropylmalate dehydratase large subunit [Leuconostoc carnosum]
MSKTLFDKIWNTHVIAGQIGEPQLLYVDLHLIHEVTSPQPFDGLRSTNRRVRRPDLTFATMDHNVPTKDIFNIQDQMSRLQMDTLAKNTKEFDIPLAAIGDDKQGIVHVVGPERGLTQPAKIIVCGDSHTATHGAFGAIAFGIGTSEVEHVLATQSIWQMKPKTMGIKITGQLPKNIYAKDIIMGIIAKHGVSFGVGYAIEFYGEVVEKLSMEARMTMCNMSIEAGSKTGMVRPDQTTFDYLKGREQAPKRFDDAVAYWSQFYTDDESEFDARMTFDVSELKPMVTWGTNPGMALSMAQRLPGIQDENDQKAYDYIGLHPSMKPEDIPLDYIFIGSCTNSRYEDLEIAANMMVGKHLAPNITAWIVPGSRAIRNQAIKNGLAKIFIDAGCEWREPGCSACLAMNPDKIPAGKHVASTSNRNFIGRQGAGSRTHLASPAMVAAAGIAGHFVDISSEDFV